MDIRDKITKYASLAENENYRADYIKGFFQGHEIEESLSSQIKQVLSLQSHARNGPEIGGSIFDNNGLELRVIDDSPIREKVESALRSFESGDYSGLSTLYEFTTRFLEMVEAKPDASPHTIAYVNTFIDTFDPHHNPKDLTEDLRGYEADLFKRTMLNRVYFPGRVENEVDAKGFLGLFHVHCLGTLPNAGDILLNQRRRIPEMIIAANLKPRPSEPEASVIDTCKLYLVHSGSYEKIYSCIFRFEPETQELDLFHI